MLRLPSGRHHLIHVLNLDVAYEDCRAKVNSRPDLLMRIRRMIQSLFRAEPRATHLVNDTNRFPVSFGL